MIKKLLTLLFFTFLTSLSYGQCVQMGGSTNCQEADSYWITNIAESAKYETFDALVSANTALACSILSPVIYTTCYLQSSASSPPLPPSGRTQCDSSPNCFGYTQKVETSDNTAGNLVVTGLHQNGYSYAQYAIVALHIRVCPSRTTPMVPDSSKSLVVCYPNTDTIASIYTACPTCDAKMRGEATFGDPINIANPVKTITELDYIYSTSNPFIFRRFYNSALNKWRTEYDRSISYSNTSAGELAIVNRPNFQSILFKKISGNWLEQNTQYGTTLTASGNDFIYITEDNEIEFYENVTYSLTGTVQLQLKTIKYANGNIQTLNYNSGLLNKVIDIFGNEFFINTVSDTNTGCIGKIVTSVTGPGLVTTLYQYGYNCKLEKVTYPDGNVKIFNYGSYALREVIDENSNLFDNTGYTRDDDRGIIANSDGLGSLGIINKVTRTGGGTNINLTDANYNSVGITITNSIENPKITGYSKYCSFCTGEQGSAINYNSSGYIDSLTDFNSNTTTFTYTP